MGKKPLYQSTWDMFPTGEPNTFTLKPGKPRLISEESMTVSQAKELLECSRQMIYIHIEVENLVVASRTPGKIKVTTESVYDLLENLKDEEWWTETRRKRWSEATLKVCNKKDWS